METNGTKLVRTQALRGCISGALLLALAVLTGCQGLSTAKPAAQGTQSPSPGALSASPASVSFGSVQAATSKTQSETLTNTGGSSITVTQVGVSGGGFNTSGLNLPLTLTAGQSATFSILFEPQSSGSFNGSLAITSNASNPSLTVTLSGSAPATQSQGQLSVTPATINTGSVTVGTTGTQSGTLTATGASIAVSSASVAGSEFVISGLSFPFTIPAGQSVNFTVTFTPETSGIASVDASFTSDAANSPAAATLTGTGVAGPAYTVVLSWAASKSPNVVGYNIYRSNTGANGKYEQINRGLDGITSYTDTSVLDGATYYYETTAMNSSDEESARSTPVAATIPAP